jgi:hypothetical protein
MTVPLKRGCFPRSTRGDAEIAAIKSDIMRRINDDLPERDAS